MKAFKFTPLRSIYILFSFLATTTAALAAPPVPVPDSVSGVLGSPFPDPLDPAGFYEIRTDQDATSDSPVIYSAQGLPEGLLLNPVFGEIFGTPTESGVFTVEISATNSSDETGEGTLFITIDDPSPVITSPLVIFANAGESYTYTISASNNPTGFSVLGLSAMDTDAITPIDLSTGSFSFTPSVSGVGDTINLLIGAENSQGSDVVVLEVTILPALVADPLPATVSLDAPLAASVFDPLLTTTVDVSATVTPDAGETLDSVFVRWNNPPAKPDGSARAPIILTSLNGPVAGGVFTGTINIGFDPENRELGGGNIDLEVVAYQTNAADSDNFGSDSINITVKPLLDILFPDDELERSNLAINDIFASARVSTNDFAQVSARISGPGIVELVENLSSNPNGVYNFNTTQAIAFTGTYNLRVEAVDGSGLSTVIERNLSITETPSDPVAVVTFPNPGFTNEVFSPAFITFAQQSSEPVTVQGVGVVGFNITYRLNLLIAGQGYFPRNGTAVSIPTTASQNVTRSVSGVSMDNGRVNSVPETVTFFFSSDENGDGIYDDPEPRWGASGNAVMDDLSDPGTNGKIEISAQFFQANAPLTNYKLFVNGEDVTPGSGNLDPSLGLIDNPVIDFPFVGSPDLGDYVVTAQVFDADGNLDESSPISFQILPYEPLEISLSRQVAAGNTATDPIIIGSSATFLADVSPIDSIDFVEFFESNSGDKLGDGSRVQIGGQEFYRCAIIFPEAGDFKVYAFATGFNGQTVNSAPIEITVESGEFPEVSIIAPLSGSDVPAGDNLEILINANDPDGQITVVEVFNGSTANPDNLLGSATPTGSAGNYRLNFTPTVADAGVLNLIARATDDRGNATDSDVALIGVVLGAVPVIEILSPSAGTEFFVGQPFEIRARITDPTLGGSITSATLTDVNFITSVSGINGSIIYVGESISFSPLNDVMSQSSTPDEYVYMATINSPDVVGMVITATDNSGNVTQSAPLEFTVTNGIVPDVAITAVNSTVLGEVSVEPLLAGVEYEILTLGDTDFAALSVDPDPVFEVGAVFTSDGTALTGTGTVRISGAVPVDLGSVVTLEISASDSDGNVTQVEVFNGANSIGFASLAGVDTYRFDYQASSPGLLNLQVRATDDLGNIGLSDLATVSVITGAIPTATITSPADGHSINSGETLEISIEAADTAPGFITSVEMFNNGVSLGFANLVSVNAATPALGTYRFDYPTTATDIGNLNLQARAVDNQGNIGFSDLVEINVVQGAVPEVIINKVNRASLVEVSVDPLIAGAQYEILAADTTDFRILGAADNNEGTRFTYNGTPLTGTGTFKSALGVGTLIAGAQYEIVTLGDTDFAALSVDPDLVFDVGTVFTSNVTALTGTGTVRSEVIVGTLIAGAQYEILTVGTGVDATDFTTLGAADSNVGTVFTYNGIAGAGTGTVRRISGAVPVDLGSIVTLGISASDNDGNVSQVEVFNGVNSIGFASLVGVNTYRFDYQASSPGLLNLQVRATDDLGNIGFSDLVQVSVIQSEIPTVTIDSPDAGDDFKSGETLEITVTATDANTDGFITSVEVFDNDVSLGFANPTGASNSYLLSYRTSAADLGNLNLQARATDNQGNIGFSDLVVVGVVQGAVPTVSIDDPLNGKTFFINTPIALTITADDADDSIITLEVFSNGASLGFASSLGGNQYEFALTDTGTAGLQRLTAVATDELGNSTTSAEVNILLSSGVSPVAVLNTVNGAVPAVAPAVDVVDRGSIVTLGISASGSDGNVTQVEVFNGANSIGLASLVEVNTYRFDYQASSPGLLNLQVRATDDLGNIGLSDLATVSVITGVVPTITIDSPDPADAEKNIFNYGDVIPFEITASDPDGSISSVRVEVLSDGTSSESNQVSSQEASGQEALKIDSVDNDQYRYSLKTADLAIAGTKLISVSAVDNRGNVSIDVVEIRLDVVPFSVNFVTQTAGNTAPGSITTPITSPHVITGASNEYYSVTRPFTVEIDGIDASTLASLDWQLQLDDGSALVSVSETLAATAAVDGQAVVEATSLTFTQSFEFSGTRTLTVTATNSDGVEVQSSLTVFVDLPDPSLYPDEGLEDFIYFIYKQVQGSVPSEEELQDAIEYILYELGGDTPVNRAAFADTLFPLDQYSNSLSQTVALVYKTLTGQWPTQAQLLAGIVTIFQDTTVRDNQTRVPNNGSITAGGTQTFSYNYSEGDEVVIIVTGDDGSGNRLYDPTLTVTRPDGSSFPLIDDSRNPESGIFSLYPAFSFTASQTGVYTATVGGYNNVYSGDFAIESTSTAIESNIDILAARALVEALKGEYNGSNGFLADADTDSFNLAPSFVAQIYRNKHGVGITTLNSGILGQRLTGIDEDMSNGYILPGYQSDVVNFVADFALDVNLATGPIASIPTGDGYPYSKIIYYGRPNNPLLSWDQARAEIQSDANLNSALSALLGIQNPTASDLAPYAGMTLEQALAVIFASDEFAAQFPGKPDADGDGSSDYIEALLGTNRSDVSVAPTAVDSLVAQIMIDLGVVDPTMIAADDDADGDGVSNYAEILLTTDPSDGSVAPTTADSSVAQIMIDLGILDRDRVAADDDADGDGVSNIAEILLNTDPSDGSEKPTLSGSPTGNEFVLEFVRLKPEKTPAGISIVVQCSSDLLSPTSWTAVPDLESELEPSADQSGITSDYERLELRIDTTGDNCSFFRLSVQ